MAMPASYCRVLSEIMYLRFRITQRSMDILVIAATSAELDACRPVREIPELDFSVTGIGSPATIYSLMSLLRKKSYDGVIQAGIAGSYSSSLPVGSVAEITADCFADLGYDDRGHFVSATEAGWLAPDVFPYSGGWLQNRSWFASKGIPGVKGITVNTASGSKDRIDQLISGYCPDLETMETAAFFQVCLCEKIPFASLRAVSNPVEPRDRGHWDLSLALQNLSRTFGELFGDSDICRQYIDSDKS